MSEPEILAYLLLKGLYVCGIVCGLTPPFLLFAVLFYEWRRGKNDDVIGSVLRALRVLVGVSEPQAN